uniref:Uncharacterized protein n=1 Tax=Timema cristinae TaxID=61476 RepID=A0A7R9C9I1_TIMCR|nr:unnamed protein product [Timema cristinae]
MSLLAVLLLSQSRGRGGLRRSYLTRRELESPLGHYAGMYIDRGVSTIETYLHLSMLLVCVNRRTCGHSARYPSVIGKVHTLANALVVLSPTAEDGETEARISVGQVNTTPSLVTELGMVLAGWVSLIPCVATVASPWQVFEGGGGVEALCAGNQRAPPGNRSIDPEVVIVSRRLSVAADRQTWLECRSSARHRFVYERLPALKERVEEGGEESCGNVRRRGSGRSERVCCSENFRAALPWQRDPCRDGKFVYYPSGDTFAPFPGCATELVQYLGTELCETKHWKLAI